MAASPNSNFSAVFATNFSEVNLRQENQTGTWWYDFPNLRQRIDRSYSGADRYVHARLAIRCTGVRTQFSRPL